jgi:hypothetical protein
VLNKDQADTAAEALLSPAREAQEAAHQSLLERLEKKRRKQAVLRRASIYGFAGFGLGAFIGHIYLGNFVPSALGLMGLGLIIGTSIHRRAA